MVDITDRKILSILQSNARVSHAEIGEKIGLSTSAVNRRIKILEQDGVISGYAAVLDGKKMGKGASVFVQVTLKTQRKPQLDEFERAVATTPEVVDCFLMTGEMDYLLRVVVQDAADYERVHHETLTQLPGVERVMSQFTIRRVFQKSGL
ncbi:Lrp/AsnC family transcriptional regulator [Hirschia maritima]|uniref:Lrp/AsnC family transcriptional regulator n=1 Tax=Hirschia maritima TaxID=1121961 RepID=UPI0003828E8F|nr:Lrp/AsnC family transcriptional regulator [Hirschia maritima]